MQNGTLKLKYFPFFFFFFFFSLLIQMLILSRDTLSNIPRIILDKTSGHLLAQSSWHIKLTIVVIMWTENSLSYSSNVLTWILRSNPEYRGPGKGVYVWRTRGAFLRWWVLRNKGCDPVCLVQPKLCVLGPGWVLRIRNREDRLGPWLNLQGSNRVDKVKDDTAE